MARRRSVITSLGVLATTGLVGTASARTSTAPNGAVEIGLADRLKELLGRNKVSEARRLLEQHDIRHDISMGASGGVTIQDGSHIDPGQIGCSLVHLEDDRYLASGMMEFETDDNALDPRRSHLIDDVCGLTWDPNEWTSPDRTTDNLWHWVTDPNEIEYDEYNYYGTTATVDEKFWFTGTAGVSQQTELIRRNDHSDIGVKFAYESNVAWVSRTIASIAIGYGGISVSLPHGAARKWRKETSTDPP